MKVKSTLSSLEKLIKVVKELRTPETGCPWDLEQTHKSLRPYMIEEAFEAVEAIDSGDKSLICDELGDVLLQVILHGQIAEDNNDFTLGNIADNITEKMVRRHPHVFGNKDVKDSEEVLKNWEAIKLEENKESHSEDHTPYTSSLRKIPGNLPALLKAQRVGGKAAKAGFDWDRISSVFDKVKEEISELETEMKKLKDSEGAPAEAPIGAGESSRTIPKELTQELGDVLFSLCQLSRWLGTSAEDCLRESTGKFIKRFELMESSSARDLGSLDEKELENLWQEAKKRSR